MHLGLSTSHKVLNHTKFSPAALHAMAYINTLLSRKSTLHIKPDGTRSSDPKLEEAVKEQVREQQYSCNGMKVACQARICMLLLM